MTTASKKTSKKTSNKKAPNKKAPNKKLAAKKTTRKKPAGRTAVPEQVIQPPERIPFEMRIYSPVEKTDGALHGTLQIFTVDKEDPKQLDEKVLNFSKEFEVALDLVIGKTGATRDEVEGELRARIIDARRVAQSAREAGGYQEPKYAQRARQIVEELADGGRFIDAEIGRFYVNGVSPVPVRITHTNGTAKTLSEEMAFKVRRSFGINPAEQISGYLANELEFRASENGDKVTPRFFSYYNIETNTLYVDEEPGKMLRITVDGIEQVENGIDGVLFVPQVPWTGWKYTPVEWEEWGFRPEIIDSIAFIEGDQVPLQPAEQAMLLLDFCVSIFFRQLMPTRPIVAFIGDSDSGKSAAIRIIGKILFGLDFDVDKLFNDKEDDFWDVIASRVVVGWDNLDGRVKWLEDALATIATGVQRSKRRLYSNDDIITYKPDTFLMLTARTPLFRRQDVSNRLLLFRLGDRDELGKKSVGESVLNAQLRDNRDRYMSELVIRAQMVLRHPIDDGSESPIRIADFYAVAKRIAASQNELEALDQAMQRLRDSQHDFAAEGDVVVLACEEWVDGLSAEGQPNYSRTVQAKNLMGELKKITEDSGLEWDLAMPSTFGSAMSEAKKSLAGRGIFVEKQTKGGKGVMYRIMREEHLADGGGTRLV